MSIDSFDSMRLALAYLRQRFERRLGPGFRVRRIAIGFASTAAAATSITTAAVAVSIRNRHGGRLGHRRRRQAVALLRGREAGADGRGAIRVGGGAIVRAIVAQRPVVVGDGSGGGCV